MKAIECKNYGSVDVLQINEVPRPTPKPNEVLVRNYATTISSADTMMRIGKPYIGRLYLGLKRPNKPILGFEFAGEVVEVGSDVRNFKPGDKVFGGTTTLGCYAEYVCVNEDGVILKMPSSITYEEASPVSGSGITILNYLKGLGNIKKNDTILINGAAGGLGSYAVQYAKHIGAIVTGVCGTGNIGFVKSLGADTVIDYTQEDVTKSDRKFDIIFDSVGKLSFAACKKILTANGVYLSPVINFPLFMQTLRTSITGSKKAKFSFTGMVPVKVRLGYFNELSQLLETGTIRTAIGKRYSMAEIADAHEYVETGHKKGNAVLVME
jgi:NADPH:quinone reductase-like Zn-dependent oxidoreductase